MIFEENNPAGIKAVLKKMNYCEDAVRLPLVPATEKLQSKITDLYSTVLVKNYLNTNNA